MENSTTVRIDLQRLQILNDRLCQTLEALNQVRMSCQSATPGYGYGYGIPQQNIWGTAYNPWTVAPGYFAGHNPYHTPYNTGFPTPFATQFAPTPNTYSNGFDRSRMAFGQPAVW